ncbi:MAG: hypothetical protein HC825_10830 [Oscillatoriales cyanobacterium RM1_1_9]|nr:hypothetical protein [Oscillatoriales cyanobacterium SM2_3_0]NJO45337.1 hypothetical protein [Oscillatoriales cyanobacterium RM2_1_1]NJO72029.1 hypothetical protein [Oscillatoriales cyanobacterium RM1_1_9]
MYKGRSQRDPLVVAVIGALGAGVATSFAVGQGQDPLVALGITVFAGLTVVLCDRFGLV